MPAQISLSYDANEDRLYLVILNELQQGHWWLTRRMALRLLKAWLRKLDEVAPPALNLPWMPPPAERKLHQEHELSLEFDALRKEPKRTELGDVVHLVTTVQLNVTELETKLTLIGADTKASLPLTRKESHALLEALGLHARKAHWIDGLALPEWIGQSQPGQGAAG